MKSNLFFITIIFLNLHVLRAQNGVSQKPAQNTPISCEALLRSKLNFLLDGSFKSEEVPAQEIAKLKSCGADDFDVQFFGTMNAITTMLTKMTKDKKIEKLTYNDLLTEIEKVKKTGFYLKMREINELTTKLASRVGSFKNWPEDERLFDALGSSTNIKNKVLQYLREHPDNTKSYKEILESFKR